MSDTQPTTTDELAPAPDDADDAVAIGYAVYDRTLQRYVTGVTDDKPSATDAKAAVRKGHKYAIVRV